MKIILPHRIWHRPREEFPTSCHGLFLYHDSVHLCIMILQLNAPRHLFHVGKQLDAVNRIKENKMSQNQPGQSNRSGITSQQHAADNQSRQNDSTSLQSSSGNNPASIKRDSSDNQSRKSDGRAANSSGNNMGTRPGSNTRGGSAVQYVKGDNQRQK